MSRTHPSIHPSKNRTLSGPSQRSPLSSLSLFLFFVPFSFSGRHACSCRQNTRPHAAPPVYSHYFNIFGFSFGLSAVSLLSSPDFLPTSNTCKAFKTNSRYSRNRNDGCYFHKPLILFPTATNSELIRTFKSFSGWRKEEVGFSACRRSGLNATRHLSTWTRSAST